MLTEDISSQTILFHVNKTQLRLIIYVDNKLKIKTPMVHVMLMHHLYTQCHDCAFSMLLSSQTDINNPL